MIFIKFFPLTPFFFSNTRTVHILSILTGQPFFCFILISNTTRADLSSQNMKERKLKMDNGADIIFAVHEEDKFQVFISTYNSHYYFVSSS